MPRPIERLPLFAIILRAADGSMAGESVIERGLTKEAAEKAAAVANEEGSDMFVATVRAMKWAVVRVA